MEALEQIARQEIVPLHMPGFNRYIMPFIMPGKGYQPLECAVGNPGGLPNTNGMGQIQPINKPNTFIIPYGNLTGLGGDMHDTFSIDRYHNMFNQHSTVRLPNNQNYHQQW